MKSKKIAIALTLTLILGATGTVFAAETSGDTKQATIHQALGMARATGLRGYDYVTSVLKDKLGLTSAQITDELNSGKTVYELAKGKGMSEEAFQAALLAEKSKAVDTAITKGTITKEEGAILKENLKTNAESCTGNFGEGNKNSNGRGNAHGSGGGMMGGGRGFSK
ncbi:hypothetical protein [Clostridium lacusfryxellense]|uniref:hypothetical protein n=1 Tax=Clostridium lacusfryxellense TaxID=205328 RepID=UPI001C0CE146|nr:hypothetical protein [Clostridium lacusfryxellense]MBU3113458.1 hypothetical protein [Clostridium lacusfryxellense]